MERVLSRRGGTTFMTCYLRNLVSLEPPDLSVVQLHLGERAFWSASRTARRHRRVN